MRLAIRRARAGDAAAFRLLEAGWEDAARWSEAHFLREIEGEDAVFLAAEEDGEIAGFAGYRRAADEAQVTSVAVARGRGGRGVGRALLEALLAEARREGLSRATLEFREGNAAAERLYRGLGFRVVGRREKFYDYRSAAVLMDLPL